ncbi:MAG: hypothetical protein JXA68_04230 [Ignavibacteriales bacterium]|nr:hypothetical protein [Ignavibacteriales bacterium]
MDGWISLHRKLQDNPLWFCESFTKGQAWVDLLLIANYDENYFYKRGVKINIKRGQVGWSELALSERWKWSRSKVRKFLKDLEKEHQITQQKSNVTQILTIVNYDLYQNKEQQNVQQKDTKKTPKRHQKDTNNKDNKDNKDNNIETIQLNFKNEVKKYTQYDITLLKEFYNYWSEPTRDKTKMRKDLEKTWDTGRRLTNWFNRQKK